VGGLWRTLGDYSVSGDVSDAANTIHFEYFSVLICL